jgi:hypothetical protein
VCVVHMARVALNYRRMKESIKHRLLRIAAAFGLGGLAIGVVAWATGSMGDSSGFPLVWGTPIASCAGVNPFNGCGYAYHDWVVVLDYLIWVAVSYLVLLGAAIIRHRATKFTTTTHAD